ncbi:MAG: hypothetical protein Kow00124_31330 [Anaerolineae bacterium]
MKTLLIAGLVIEIGLLIALAFILPAAVRSVSRRLGPSQPVEQKENER